jgi:hypothetical protein
VGGSKRNTYTPNHGFPNGSVDISFKGTAVHEIEFKYLDKNEQF